MSSSLTMHCTMRPYWVTIAPDRTRTRDVRLMARSAWAASWLHQQLHPGVEVVMVREVG
jgi:hypothetical protein